jgi:hypothetical protein
VNFTVAQERQRTEIKASFYGENIKRQGGSCSMKLQFEVVIPGRESRSSGSNSLALRSQEK